MCRSVPWRNKLGSERACGRLLAEKGLACDACIDPSDFPADVVSCPEWAHADDVRTEEAALFGQDEPRDSYKRTRLLFDDSTVKRVRFEVAAENWTALIKNPAAEKYVYVRAAITMDGTAH